MIDTTENNSLFEAFDIEYFLQREGIDYKKCWGSNGLQLNIRTCPVCGHSKWKVYINADTGLGNCFSGSCESTFNKFSFVKAVMGIDDNRKVWENIRNISRELGWIPKVKQETFKPKIITGADLKLPECIDLPTPDGQNLEYLVRRGIDNYYTELFELKYCEYGEWKYITPVGEKTQIFQKRIIIPIRDLDTTMVAFQGRDVTGLAPNKYQFPSQVAATGKLLYNGCNALGFEDVILNEGVFDVIATKMAIDKSGLINVGVVGSFGKHLSIDEKGDNDQLNRLLRLKKEGMKKIIIMWDGEPAAYKDAVGAGTKLKKYGFNPYIATLPKGKDPNEVHYTEVIKAYKEAKPVDEIPMLLNNPYS